MDTSHLTITARDILQSAFSISLAHGNRAVEPVHILKAMLGEENSLTGYLLSRLGADTSVIGQHADAVIDGLTKAGGGEQYLSKGSLDVLQSALESAEEFNDRYISVEHLLIGLYRKGSVAGRLLKDEGITDENLIRAIKDMRKEESITRQAGQQIFNALKK